MLLAARPSQVPKPVRMQRAVSDVTHGDVRQTAIPKNDSPTSN
jgi:hypothetical protein